MKERLIARREDISSASTLHESIYLAKVANADERWILTPHRRKDSFLGSRRELNFSKLGCSEVSEQAFCQITVGICPVQCTKAHGI